MTDTARIDDDGLLAAGVTKPSLQIVPDAVMDELDGTEPNFGRSGLVGYLTGFLVVAVTITIAGTLAGFGFGNSAGFGAFVGIWSGGGFGFMLGATIPFARYLDAQSARSTNDNQGEHDAAEDRGTLGRREARRSRNHDHQYAARAGSGTG